MNKTERLKLNQWDPTDQILRTDFNEDNRKIEEALTGLDAALAAAPGRLEMVREQLPKGTATASCSMDLRTIKWDQWDVACALVRYPTDGEGNTQINVKLDINTRDYQSYEFEAMPQPGYMLVLFPRHDPESKVSGFLLNDRFIPFSCDFAYQDLSDFLFRSASYTAVPFPHVQILGRK